MSKKEAYTGYDEALYAAATSYLQSKTSGRSTDWFRQKEPSYSKVSGSSGWASEVKLDGHGGLAVRTGSGSTASVHSGSRSGLTYDPSQYCDVCQLYTSGPQAMKQHVDGAKHKSNVAKRGQTVVKGVSLPSPSAAVQKASEAPDAKYYCNLCREQYRDQESFSKHLKGLDHVNLSKRELSRFRDRTTVTKRVVGVANTQFVSGQQLVSTPTGVAEVKTGVVNVVGTGGNADEAEFEPVGEDYVHYTGRSKNGRTLTFYCKLCDATFYDQAARDLHVKGRRHRIQYKAKVDPTLNIDDVYEKERRQKGTLQRAFSRDTRDALHALKQDDTMLRMRQQQHGMPDGDPIPLGSLLFDRQHGPQGQQAAYYGAAEYRREGPVPVGAVMGHGRQVLGYARPAQRGTTEDDRLIVRKHNQLYPSDDELLAMQILVSVVEQALFLISDRFVVEDHDETLKKIESNDDDEDTVYFCELCHSQCGSREAVEAHVATPRHGNLARQRALLAAAKKAKDGGDGDDDKEKDESGVASVSTGHAHVVKRSTRATGRRLQGVHRVGHIATGLLIRNDRNAELVCMCAEPPTQWLLAHIYSLLPDTLKQVHAEGEFICGMDAADACLFVTTTSSPAFKVRVTLTCTKYRSTEQAPLPANALSRKPCLKALAEIRRVKWFQVRCDTLPSFMCTMRIVRDFCQRVPTWSKLQTWVGEKSDSLELLVERVLSSAGEPLTPAESLRRLFESIAYGVLLKPPAGVQLCDPCEREPHDVLAYLSAQEREDITSSSQHALRLIAFNQLHLVLSVARLAEQHRQEAREARQQHNKQVADRLDEFLKTVKQKTETAKPEDKPKENPGKK